jgi:hypothetical protein
MIFIVLCSGAGGVLFTGVMNPLAQSGSRGMIRNPAARLKMQTIDCCYANPGSGISSLFLFLLSHFALLDPNQNQFQCGSGSATLPLMQLHSHLPSNSSICSDANPGCLSRITDPNFSIQDPGSKRFWIPDPDRHQRINVYLTQKIVF